MSDNGYFSHSSQDGRSPWTRATNAGTSASAENIAAGRGTAVAVLEQWKGSNGHCKNMMNLRRKAFAVGYAAGGSYRHYWTQMFRDSVGDVETSCHTSHGLLEAAAAVTDADMESVEDPSDLPMPDPCTPDVECS